MNFIDEIHSPDFTKLDLVSRLKNKKKPGMEALDVHLFQWFIQTNYFCR